MRAEQERALLDGAVLATGWRAESWEQGGQLGAEASKEALKSIQTAVTIVLTGVAEYEKGEALGFAMHFEGTA